MRRYETIFIAPVELPDNEMNDLVERFEAIITGRQGIVVKRENWGKRKLAYEIKKQNRGYYTLLDYVAKSEVVTELERNLRIDDKVLKYMTVKKADKVDLDQIEKELAASKEPPQVEPPVMIQTADAQKSTEIEAGTPQSQSATPDTEGVPAEDAEGGNQ
ncbi:MAG: 30S ribosomal protein S6 [Deltaproteobacteria bacterium]|nr:30S ribosomal protein S6 [Deltaproteobacteria bacterium]